MIDSERDKQHHDTEETESADLPEDTADQETRLSAAARREALADLSRQLGDAATIEGDKLTVETNDPVALDIQIEADGSYTLVWWITTTTPEGHPRWRDAAAGIVQAGESIHTSALGGGYLVEVRQHAATSEEALARSRERAPIERAHTLLAAFPAEIGKLPIEPVPDYLLPDRDPSRSERSE